MLLLTTWKAATITRLTTMINDLANAAASAVGMGGGRSATRRTSKKTKIKAAKRVLSSVGLKAVRKGYSAPARRTKRRKTRRRY